MINFSLSKEDAIQEIVSFFNQHQRIHGEYVNKQVDIVDNPGFPISIYKSPFDNKLEIKIDQINSIEFIDILTIYLDSIIRLLLFSEEIPPVLLADSSRLCSKMNFYEEEVKLDNVIINNRVPILLPLEPDNDVDKYLPDEEEGEGYLPQEEAGEGEGYLPEEEDDGEEVEDGEELDEDEEDEEVGQDDGDEDEEEGYLPEEEEEEEVESEGKSKSRGGTKGNEKTNIFTKRMKDKEPNLILTKPQGKFVSYSRICPANANLQPVILTDDEKKDIDKDHPGAYTNAIKYGSDPKNQFWYICPRYWCLKTNKPMTEEEVKRGECGGKIIPKDVKKNPPPGHFIYEFTDDKYHKDDAGEYIWHSPGFKPPHSHPNSNLCLPCCFSNWASKNKNPSQQQTRRQQCGLVDVNVNKIGPDGKKSQESYQTVPDENATEELVVLNKPKVDSDVKKEKERKKQEGKANVFGVERYPIPQYRWGFLPTSVERFLHTKNNKFVLKSNPAYIQSGKQPLLRYGVEQSINQSFVGVLSDIYSHYKDIKLLTIEQMREKIVELLTLDDYLKLHNGSLTSIFKQFRIENAKCNVAFSLKSSHEMGRLNEKRCKPSNKNYPIDDVAVEDYSSTLFYNSVDLNNPSQYAFLKDTISSFNNFQNYLKDKDTIIDHSYLWDIISSEDSVLFEGGLNMIIIEIVNNDITDNIDLICPTNAYSSNIYIKDRGTILILKHDDFYEPIYLYNDNKKNKSQQPIRIFTDLKGTDELKSLKKIFSMVMDVSERKCKPMKTRPRIYKFKENISAKELFTTLSGLKLKVNSQVMNYNGKIIALMTEIDGKEIYLPCFPSKILDKIPQKFMNAVEWHDYILTRNALEKISTDSNGKILCKPMMKVTEDGLIVGILTVTNQFIQIREPTEDIFAEDLPIFSVTGYRDGKLDNSLAISRNYDENRINTINNIKLESQFYLAYRTEIRNLLNNYDYREIRDQIVSVLDNHKFLYTLKMKKLAILIRYLIRDIFTFVDDLNNVFEKEKIVFPRKNLINSETDNEVFYLNRICDELIRFKRIRLFLLDDKRYLNIANIDYSVNEDEVILLNSILTDEYFDDLIPFQNNKYAKNITYEIATPSKNSGFYQNFSGVVPLGEQNGPENSN
jgi:hypothetical protein